MYLQDLKHHYFLEYSGYNYGLTNGEAPANFFIGTSNE